MAATLEFQFHGSGKIEVPTLMPVDLFIVAPPTSLSRHRIGCKDPNWQKKKYITSSIQVEAVEITYRRQD